MMQSFRVGGQKERYTLINHLGQGGKGEVFLVRDENTGGYHAMKIVWNAEEGKEEADLLKSLSHSGIPKLYDYFEKDGHSFLIMEYVKGITLRECMERASFSRNERKDIMIKAAEILCYLHSRPVPVVHGDLKPDNIIITEEREVFLIDFGSAFEVTEKKAKMYSTEKYAAPEIVKGEYRPSGDVYGFGVIFAGFMTGKNPDLFEKDPKVYKRLGLSSEEARIVFDCLRNQPRMRYQSAKELLTDLKKSDRKVQIREKMENLESFLCVDIGGVMALYGLGSYYLLAVYKGKFLILFGCVLLFTELVNNYLKRKREEWECRVLCSLILVEKI